jgi:hypothetical protein
MTKKTTPELPAHVSEAAKSLLKSLLSKQAANRPEFDEVGSR